MYKYTLFARNCGGEGAVKIGEYVHGHSPQDFLAANWSTRGALTEKFKQLRDEHTRKEGTAFMSKPGSMVLCGAELTGFGAITFYAVYARGKPAIEVGYATAFDLES